MLWGWRRASDQLSTGAKQASDPSKTLHHSSRVFALKVFANCSRIFGQPAGDAEAEQHAAAAEVAHQVERRHRRLAFSSESVQHAGEGDVVDVVAGARRERPALAPAGHAAVNQARVFFKTFMRT